MKFPNLFNFIKKFFILCFNLNVFYLRNYLKFQLKVIWTFTDTFPGYLIFLFCTFYGVSGLHSQSNEILKAWCMLFVIFIAGSTLQWYILIKLPSTKKLLENFVGKEFIISHLGEYTGSKALIKVAATLTPVFLTVGSEVLTNAHAQALNIEKANNHLRLSVDTYKENSLEMNQKNLDKHIAQAQAIASQPTKGLVTKAIDSQALIGIAESVSSIFTKKNN